MNFDIDSYLRNRTILMVTYLLNNQGFSVHPKDDKISSFSEALVVARYCL